MTLRRALRPRARQHGTVMILALAVFAAGCSGGGHGGVSPSASSPAGGSAVAAATHAITPASITTALTSAAIATVADESSTTPEIPLAGSPVLTVTAWQATNMAEEAASGGGITGADLNTMLPMPAQSPQLADVVGGWALSKGDPAELAAGALLGNPDWSHPDTVVFPTAVLTLFVGDLLQHIAQSQDVASSAPASSGPASAPASDAAWHLSGVRIEDASLVTAPCSTVSNFVNEVLDRVFSLLKLNPATVAASVSGALGGGVVGTIAGSVAGFFAGFWNHAVDLAEQAVQQVLKTLTQPVLNALAVLIGGVAVISMIRSYLKAWKTTVTPKPAGNAFSIDPKLSNPGTFTVTIDRNAEIEDWPPQLVDCAAAADVPLPTLATAGSPVVWTVTEQEAGLVTVGSPTGLLGKDFTQTMDYSTGHEDARTAAKGTLVTPTITAAVKVRRTEVEELRQFVTAYVTGKVPNIIAPVVNPILSYYINLATTYLDQITAVTGSSTIVVSHHVIQPSPSPSPRASSSCAASGTTIPAGTYTGPINATITTQLKLNLGGAQIPNAGGGSQSLTGAVKVVSDGSTVTGTITLAGGGTSEVGLPGSVNVHSSDSGQFRGTVSGPASKPVVGGALSGQWASYDAPVINGAGAATSTVHAGLHITRADCSSISGDAVAMFAEFAASVAQYLTFGGSGTWTASRQ